MPRSSPRAQPWSPTSSRLRAQEVDLHADLAEHATDFERVSVLRDRLRVIEAERDALEEVWLARTE